MRDEALLGPWIRRFLLEHVVAERNLARNTQQGYRDGLCQLLPFVAKRVGKSIDRLNVVDLSAELIRAFLTDIEVTRRCSIATRNQRLAAVRAFAGFVGEHSPVHIEWSGQIRSIPFKKTDQAVVPYLEKAEIDALLAAPDRRTEQGRRDYALLLFLYNTGARASEAVGVKVADLDLNAPSVKIHGKGGKQRYCPLWTATVVELRALVADGAPSRSVFLNRCGQPITRFGIHTGVERYGLKVVAKMPSLATKRVSPHSIRHTTATHLLRAGVDINTVRGWLGHVSLDTTNVYAEVDFETKAKALEKCEAPSLGKIPKRWRDQPALMDFLRSL
ncbi:MAG: integrase [Mesorhizobium sp.]|uniref:tyrosine-type recombinase/integrase n=1 Tax=Mesorhizobium sp. TaxID=1871066 RepID=UPI000FE95D17|nr:tyrosine-type recombinase/integrase [Mesorhizobium sp.]RWI31411.1 MAG: integrase [Mesorhizobium sp.]TIO54346.1 MAG: integrase [Mesorhizobium sp.]TIO59436.1 MAG: integrase [Mesorhizobium sp.]TJV63909.1 MAG: integrase [Mesorhizobium sp.]